MEREVAHSELGHLRDSGAWLVDWQRGRRHGRIAARGRHVLPEPILDVHCAHAVVIALVGQVISARVWLTQLICHCLGVRGQPPGAAALSGILCLTLSPLKKPCLHKQQTPVATMA